MNKAAIGVAIIVLLVAVGVPPVIGALTERGLRQHAETVEVIAGTPYRLDVVEYDGRWFGSTARVEARLSDDYVEQLVTVATRNDDDSNAAIAGLMIRALLSQSLPLRVEVAHGPVVVNNGVRLGVLSTVIRPDPATEGMTELLQLLGMPYLFEGRTVTAMNGDTRFSVAIPAAELQAPQARVDFSGLDLSGNFDLSARAIESAGSIEFLAIDGGVQGAVDIGSIIFDGNVTRYDSGLWLGDVRLEVGAMNFSGYDFGGPYSVSLTRAGAELDSGLDASGELVTMTGSYYVDALTSAGLADLDAQLALTDARFDLSLRSFSLEALEDYYEYSRLVRSDPRSAPPLIPGVQDMLYLTLSTSPEIGIGPLELVWDGEPLAASATIDMNGSGLPAREDFDMLDFRTLLDAVTISAYTDLSEPMAQALLEQNARYQLRESFNASGNEMTDAELESLAERQAIVTLLGLVSQGMLIATDDGYHGELLFRNGQLTINGNIIPLPIPIL